MKKKQAVNAGTSKEAAAHKKILYVKAYLTNGGNKTQAAATAGYKPGKASDQAGWRLSQDVEVQHMIAAGHEKAAAIAGLSMERTLLELARIAYSDRRKLKKDGQWIPLEELDDDTAAALASCDEGNPKFYDKNSAIEKVMKFYGLYREDNDQTRPVIVNSINYADMYKPKKAA